MTKKTGAPGYLSQPGHRIEISEAKGRHNVFLGDQLIVGSDRAIRVAEAGYIDVIYFPRESVVLSALTQSESETYCPFKGYARYWHVDIGGNRVVDGAWSYEAPYAEFADLAGYVAFQLGGAGEHWIDGVELAPADGRVPDTLFGRT